MRDGESNVLDEFRRGNVDAFETLFRLHQRAVYGWIMQILRNPAAAEDVTIETFWRIHRAHARFQPSRGFEGWARSIATHAALDWLRGHRHEGEEFGDPVPDLTANAISDPGISAEIRQKTAQAFARLPPRLRVAAVLVVVEERSHTEVAEALGVSVAAVKIRIFRALRRLRKDLQQQGITP